MSESGRKGEPKREKLVRGKEETVNVKKDRRQYKKAAGREAEDERKVWLSIEKRKMVGVEARRMRKLRHETRKRKRVEVKETRRVREEKEGISEGRERKRLD